jgi:Fe-S-cluster containining protein
MNNKDNTMNECLLARVLGAIAVYLRFISCLFMPTSIVPAFKRQLKKQRQSMRRFLKKFDTLFIRNINTYVKEASAETWAETDCLACANCCKVMTPTFRKADIERASAFLKMTPTEFYTRWLKKDPDTGDSVNKTQPCQFLDKKTNMCSIYEVRPLDCAQFPHFGRKPFGDFNHIHEQNIDYCPATFRFISKMQERIERDYQW